MNNVAFYEPGKHAEMVSKWFEAWGFPAHIMAILPSTGYVCEGVCAIFLYETNSNVCFIEGLIRNPEVDERIANECLDYIGDKIVDYARERGFEHIMSYSQYKAVADRAVKHGFKLNDKTYHCFGRNL